MNNRKEEMGKFVEALDEGGQFIYSPKQKADIEEIVQNFLGISPDSVEAIIEAAKDVVVLWDMGHLDYKEISDLRQALKNAGVEL